MQPGGEESDIQRESSKSSQGDQSTSRGKGTYKIREVVNQKLK